MPTSHSSPFATSLRSARTPTAGRYLAALLVIGAACGGSDSGGASDDSTSESGDAGDTGSADGSTGGGSMSASGSATTSATTAADESSSAGEDSSGGADESTTGAPDEDMDGIADGSDNCPDTANPNQLDFDGNGTGNVCDTTVDDHRRVEDLVTALRSRRSEQGHHT